jgi:hypothetical protein
VVDHLDVLYRFNTTDTYYVCSIGPSNGGHLLLYFPTHEWLVFRQKPSAAIARDRIQSIKRARAFLVNNYRLVARYLNSTEARATVSVIGHPNYAHHLSNELQAVERLMQSQAIDSLDKLLVSRHALGRVEWLFPELDPAKIEYREEGNEAFFAANLRENNFVIKIGDNYVSSELQHRVTRAAAQHAEPRRDLALCRGGSLDTRTVLWISIKCGDRTLVDQSSFLTGLIRNIHTHRSDLLVLFDGVSLPCDHSDVHGGRIFKKEFIEEHRRVIEEIGQHLDADGIEWISLNGKTLLETIWWTRFVDLYFTHWGSIQHKIGWFSDCPGLAHGNSSILSKSKRLTEYLRSLGRPAPLFVPESFVEDFPCDVVDLRARGGVLMDNYMLDIDATARLLLRGLARTPHAR